MADLLLERRDRTAWLTFNRPDARNAMTFEMSKGRMIGVTSYDREAGQGR